MTPRRWVAALALLALGLAACGRGPQEGGEKDEAPLVRGATVDAARATEVDEVWEVVGTVRSRTTTTLSSRVVGTIQYISPREGDRVEVGQVLVSLDDRDLQAQLRRAAAGLREAEEARTEAERGIAAAEAARASAQAQADLAAATLQRFERLLAQRSVAPQEYDQVVAQHRAALAEVARTEQNVQALAAKWRQVEARIEQARAEVATAQTMVSHTRVTAPFTGIVVAKPAEVGVLAAPGVPLITLEDPAHYRLEAAVPESAAGRLRLGQSLAVRVEAIALDTSGRVAQIVPAAEPATRTVTAKIDLPSHPQLRSGLYGLAWLPAGRRTALLVPRAAILERGQLTGVFVVEQGVARYRLVTLGKPYGDRVEILSGLAPGERIIAKGTERVTDGARVEP